MLNRLLIRNSFYATFEVLVSMVVKSFLIYDSIGEYCLTFRAACYPNYVGSRRVTSWTLKMETASSPKTSATVYYSTRRHVPERLDHHQSRYENPIYPIKSLLFNRPFAVIQEYVYLQIYRIFSNLIRTRI
jgi:hypothetical protein